MYVVRDCFRTAQMLGMPFGAAAAGPHRDDMATREIAKDQPHIHRLTRLGQAAAERGRGLPFICEVSRTHLGRPDPRLARGRPPGPGRRPRGPRPGRPGRPPSRPTPNGWRRRSTPATRGWTPSATGACPPSCSRTSRSLARTGSRFLLWRLRQHGLAARALTKSRASQAAWGPANSPPPGSRLAKLDRCAPSPPPGGWSASGRCGPQAACLGGGCRRSRLSTPCSRA